MMKNSLKPLGYLATATMILGLTSVAQAANVTTSGIWTGTTGNPPLLSGVGTNQISWGNSTGQGQSSYVFQGVNNNPLPIGTNFSLGTFTHNNFPVTGAFLTSATLSLNLQITNGNVLNQNFNFVFNHNETINNPPGGVCTNTPGFPPPCPDIVSIPDAESQETITINGQEYALFISGFQQGGQNVNQFITLEGQANSAELFGYLQRPSGAVPEPLTMFGVGTALGFGTHFKRQLAKKQKSDKNNA